MTPRPNLIPPEHIEAVWQLVRAEVARVTERDKRYWPEDVLDRLFRNTAQLWIIHDGQEQWGVVVTILHQFPRTRELEIWIVAGRERKRWVPAVLETMDEYARAQGCGRVFAVGRNGWRDDMQGYRRVATTYVRELG